MHIENLESESKLPLRFIGFIFCLAIFLVQGDLDAKEEVQVNLEVWDMWCTNIRQELLDAHIFDTNADKIGLVEKPEGISFFQYGPISVPYVINEFPKISISEIGDPRTGIVIEYDSGITITVFGKQLDALDNVFEHFSINLPLEIEGHVTKYFSSLKKFTEEMFDQPLSVLDLMISGYKLTPIDLECSKTSIFHDLVRLPKILAAGSADYSAIKAGNDIAYWSSNALTGVVSRQAESFGLGGNEPRVLWTGRFADGMQGYTVIISFKAKDINQYDVLGKLLANPVVE